MLWIGTVIINEFIKKIHFASSFTRLGQLRFWKNTQIHSELWESYFCLLIS